MDLVPRLLGTALVGFALAGSTTAFAGDATSANTALIAASPSSSDDFLLPANAKPALAPEPQFDRQDGQLDFFPVRPDVKSGDFTSLLGSSSGGAGLQFHLNW